MHHRWVERRISKVPRLARIIARRPGGQIINLLQTMAAEFARGGAGVTKAEVLLDQDFRAGAYDSQVVTFNGSIASLSDGARLTCRPGNSSCNGDAVVPNNATGTLPDGFIAGLPYFVINYTTIVPAPSNLRHN